MNFEKNITVKCNTASYDYNNRTISWSLLRMQERLIDSRGIAVWFPNGECDGSEGNNTCTIGAGQVTIGVQSSVGKRRFIWTSAQCPHVGAFRFSFLYYLVFLAEVPHFSMGRFWKDELHKIAPNYLQADQTARSYTFFSDIYTFKQIKWQTTLQENFIVEK